MFSLIGIGAWREVVPVPQRIFGVEFSQSVLGPIENPSAEDASTESVLTRSSIPAVKREHTLDAGVGLQWTLSPSVHAYGSALFALLDRGLQSTVAPTVGIAAHF